MFWNKEPAKQVTAGWCTMLSCTGGWSSPYLRGSVNFGQLGPNFMLWCLRWRCQYFYWIPLSERCKIDLKIILIRWAEHLFWIYSKYVQVGLKVLYPSSCVTHPHWWIYIGQRWRTIHSSHPHTFLSHHLIGSMTLEALLSTCGKIPAAAHLWFRSRVSAATLTSVDFGQRKVKQTWNSP